MYEFFVYDYLEHATSKPPRRICVAYCSSTHTTDAALMERLKLHFSTGIPPDLILLTGPANRTAMIEMHRSLLKSPLVVEGLPAMTKYIGPPALNSLWIEDNGTFGSEAEQLLDPGFIRQVVQQGLMRIFKDRQGMLDSLGLYHYVKPSGKHSDKFIRTANVLMRGAEVSFIAFTLLPYLLRGTITHIYTDTAAINAIAYALVSLRQNYDPGFQTPTIDSFSSYGGLQNFRFEGISDSLILISASTSHELELQLMRQHRIPQNQIVTIYYLGRRYPESNVLCDLTRNANTNPDGFEPIISFPHDDCPLCTQGLLAIKIAGDQFLPENPKVVTHTVEKKDAPRWLNGFMKDFVGTGALTCHHPGRAPGLGREHELYLDLTPMFSHSIGAKSKQESEFHQRLEYLITQIIPASLRRIIFLDDTASAELAKRIREWLGEIKSGASISLVSASEVASRMDQHVMEVGTTLVVASSIVTGRSLLAISQSLRQIQRNNSVQYLVCVSRTATEQRLDEIRKNVQYGQYGGRDHRFDTVRVIFIPDERPSPWNVERAFLINTRDMALPEHVAIIDQRLAELDSGGKHGLSNHIFWPTTTGKPLQLNPTFAFWDFKYVGPTVTQAEVYFTIAAILHESRTVRDRQGTHLDYQRVILSPRNFDRFNDGIVQASLLRAAHDWEIDYSIHKEASADMKRILESIFRNIHTHQGEAALEFLIALAQQRLRLTRQDEIELTKELRSIKGSKEISMLSLLVRS